MTYEEVKAMLDNRPFVVSKLLAENRIKFVEGECDDLIDELQNHVFDEKSDRAIPLDDGTLQIDAWDSFIYSISGNWGYSDVDNKELSKMIDEAIEKQIPKKPHKQITSDFSHEMQCPICGHRFFSKVDGQIVAGREQKYCDNCGQALDWSE